MADTGNIVAGLAAAAPYAGTGSDLLPVILAFMDGNPAVIALSAEMRASISTTLAKERAAGRLGSGGMPDTFNPAVRAQEWRTTSDSLVPYLRAVDDVAADGARVTSATVEALQGVLVSLVLIRAHADPLRMTLDPLALERFEAVLR